MKTPHEKYIAACKDADKVYYDFDAGMTEEECESLKDSAFKRCLDEIEREWEAHDAKL